MKNKSKLLLMIILIISMIATTSTAFAGNGDGTGGGKDQALSVEQSNIENGATVEANTQIVLTFNKNVVNEKVKENNLPLFVLTDKDGNTVEAEIVMADDQVEPDKKNDVTVAPKAPLTSGEYTLTAKSGITSKSGDVMGEDYTLTFSVKGTEEAADTTAADTNAPAEKNLIIPKAIGVIVVIIIAVLYAMQTKGKKKRTRK